MTTSDQAFQRAALYSDRARTATSEETRAFFTRMRNSWIRTANSQQMNWPLEIAPRSTLLPPSETGEGLPG
jgi:hypothetical protein